MSHLIDQPHLSVIAKFIESGSSWQNGRVESFNDTLRDELLNRKIFDTRAVDQTSPDAFTWAYNTFRHHASLSYESPDAIEKRFNLRYNQVEINLIGSWVVNWGLTTSARLTSDHHERYRAT